MRLTNFPVRALSALGEQVDTGFIVARRVSRGENGTSGITSDRLGPVADVSSLSLFLRLGSGFSSDFGDGTKLQKGKTNSPVNAGCVPQAPAVDLVLEIGYPLPACTPVLAFEDGQCGW